MATNGDCTGCKQSIEQQDHDEEITIMKPEMKDQVNKDHVITMDTIQTFEEAINIVEKIKEKKLKYTQLMISQNVEVLNALIENMDNMSRELDELLEFWNSQESAIEDSFTAIKSQKREVLNFLEPEKVMENIAALGELLQNLATPSNGSTTDDEEELPSVTQKLVSEVTVPSEEKNSEG